MLTRFFAITLPLLLAVTISHAAGSAAANMMSQAMLTMMDIMGNLAHQYSTNQRWSQGYIPLDAAGGIPPMAITAMPQAIQGQQQLQNFADGAQKAMPSMGNMMSGPNSSPLDGIWQGQAGEIVLVMYGHFRIYADSDHYRDGHYEINGERLIMHDPQTGNSRTYEYAYKNGRMVLRDRDGNLLLFRQLPIPIPSYSLISNQKPASPRQQAAPNN